MDDDLNTLDLKSLHIDVEQDGKHRASFEVAVEKASKAHLDRTIKLITALDPKVTHIIAYAGDKIAILELKGSSWVWPNEPPRWLH